MKSRFTILLPFLLLCETGSSYASDRAKAIVQATAQETIEQRFPDDAHRLEVRVIRTSGEWDEEKDLRLLFPSGEELPRAHTQVRILTGSDIDGWQENGWAYLYVAHFDSVAMSGTTLLKNERIDPSWISYSWIETTNFHGKPLRPRDIVLLLKEGDIFASRAIKEGKVLRRNDVRSAYAADTGDAVYMSYRRGRINLTVPCQAREPGSQGDVIRLYSTETQTNYRARLTGPGTAEWVETR